MGSELVASPSAGASVAVDNGAVDADLSQAESARERMSMNRAYRIVFFDILFLLNPLKRGIIHSLRY
jgi:hypothetical protein